MVLKRPYIKGLCGERLERSALDHSRTHCFYTLSAMLPLFPASVIFISITPFFFLDFKPVVVRVVLSELSVHGRC